MRRNVAAAQDYKNKVSVSNDAVVQFLKTHTPAEVDTWVENNVNSLADAKMVLKTLAKICAYLARREFNA